MRLRKCRHLFFLLQADDGVPPNGRHTYIWEVKPEHGPASDDSDCLTWAYHSHVNPRSDVNTGLVGLFYGVLLFEEGKTVV